MNISVRTSVIAVILILAAVTAISLGRRTGAIRQPISFNHSLHIDEVDLECTDCHLQVEVHQRATLPALEVCQDCHSEAITETVAEEKLLAYTTTDAAIPWQRIYTVPDHVYFSHRRHVTLGDLDCELCHGAVAEMTVPAEHPVMEMSMDFCVDCHAERQITNDCLACHR